MPVARAIAVCSALVVVTPVAFAQSDQDDRRGTASLRFYADDDHMTVVSPTVGAQAPVADRWLVDVNATADIISGASVDVVSEASPTAIEETRVEGGVGASYRATPTGRVRARMIGSFEDDYRSLGVSLGASVELAQRNTILDIGYSGNVNRVSRAGNDSFSEPRNGNRLTFSLTQVADQRTYVDLVVEGARLSGYLASPYRTIPIFANNSTELMRLDEVVPELRWSAVAKARLRAALSERQFARVEYRVFADDWGVVSHTALVSVIHALDTRQRLGARVRGYAQNSADFYRGRYELDDDGSAPTLRTRERRLSHMYSVFAAVNYDRAFGTAPSDRAPHLVASVAAMRFYFNDFPAQSQRTAIALTLGLNAGF